MHLTEAEGALSRCKTVLWVNYHNTLHLFFCGRRMESIPNEEITLAA